MAIVIDRPNYDIQVPRADMTLIQSTPVEIRQLDTNSFRLILRDLDDDESGRAWPITHDHNTDVEIDGINYARQVLIREPYTVTFEDGQYVVQITGSNNNILGKTNKNQVSVSPSNSAGLISSQDSEAAAFNGRVYIDVANLSGKAKNGTINPIGQLRQPSDNLSDTALIAEFRGLPTINLIGDLPLGNEAVWDSLRFEGFSTVRNVLTVNAIASVLKCTFAHLTIQGTLDGGSEIVDCDVKALNFVDGKIRQCGIEGPIELGTTVLAEFWDCKSRISGPNTPEINCNGTGEISWRNGVGGIKITNYNGSGAHSIDTAQGQTILDSATVVSGTFVVRGKGNTLVDENGNYIPSGTWNGGVTIINQTSEWDELLADHQLAGSTGEALTNAGGSGNPWSVTLAGNKTPGTFGWLVQKLLTLAKYIGLK